MRDCLVSGSMVLLELAALVLAAAPAFAAPPAPPMERLTLDEAVRRAISTCAAEFFQASQRWGANSGMMRFTFALR